MSGRRPSGRFAIIGEYSAGKTALMTAIAYRDYLQGIPIYSNYKLEFPYTHVSCLDDIDKMSDGTFVMDEAWYTFDSRSFSSKTNKNGSYILSKLAKRNMNAYLNMQSMDLLDSRFRDRMMAILIPEAIRDKPDEFGRRKPLYLNVSLISKDKWGCYHFAKRNYYFDVSQVLDLYDTSEELDPLT